MRVGVLSHLPPPDSTSAQDAMKRYKLALVRQLKKNAAGLTNVNTEDFEMHGQIAMVPPIKYVHAKFRRKGRDYLLKVYSKKQTKQMGMQARLRAEARLMKEIQGHNRLCPIPLQGFEDDSYVFFVYKTQVSSTLINLIELKNGFAEQEACFYTGVLVSALQVLHADAPTLGGIVYRNLEPQSITIDGNGWPQLLDYRFAVAAEPPPRDFCGSAHYLSPEQVQGQGHGIASDFWALGVLLYEMVMLSNPWLTGTAAKDSEVAIYSRITGHTSGNLQFPGDANITPGLAKLLNGLLEPNPEKRLGVGPNLLEGILTIKNHEWFTEHKFDWASIDRCIAASPSWSYCEKKVQELMDEAKNDPHPYQDRFDDIFNEVYVPGANAKDEFEGVTGMLMKRKATYNIVDLVNDGKRAKARNKSLKAHRVQRFERLKSKGMLKDPDNPEHDDPYYEGLDSTKLEAADDERPWFNKTLEYVAPSAKPPPLSAAAVAETPSAPEPEAAPAADAGPLNGIVQSFRRASQDLSASVMAAITTPLKATPEEIAMQQAAAAGNAAPATPAADAPPATPPPPKLTPEQAAKQAAPLVVPLPSKARKGEKKEVFEKRLEKAKAAQAKMEEAMKKMDTLGAALGGLGGKPLSP